MSEINNEQFGVQDLTVLRDCLDVACQRGAFRAEEMATIGTVYNKLTAFLQAVIAQAEIEREESNPQGEKND